MEAITHAPAPDPCPPSTTSTSSLTSRGLSPPPSTLAHSLPLTLATLENVGENAQLGGVSVAGKDASTVDVDAKSAMDSTAMASPSQATVEPTTTAAPSQPGRSQAEDQEMLQDKQSIQVGPSQGQQLASRPAQLHQELGDDLKGQQRQYQGQAQSQESGAIQAQPQQYPPAEAQSQQALQGQAPSNQVSSEQAQSLQPLPVQEQSQDPPTGQAQSQESLTGQAQAQGPLPTQAQQEMQPQEQAHLLQGIPGEAPAETDHPGPAQQEETIKQDETQTQQDLRHPQETPPITEDFFKIDGVDDVAPVSLADIPEAETLPADAMTDAMSLADGTAILDSMEPAVEEPDPMQAFAKLSFPDGDFYVHTYAVELGRDVNAHKHERKRGKLLKRREKNERKEMAERRRKELDLDLDEDQDKYPKPPMSVSNVSEVGGIMGIDIYSSDENSRTSRRRRKKSFRSSNSEHSLDPNTLHANPQDLLWDHEAVTPPRGLPEGLPDHAYQCPLIPIHPQVGASFKGISRRHVRIEYNLEHGVWEMFVTGRNTVFHDNDRIETGGSARLHHGSEIIIQTITIIFKLPDNAREEDEEIQAMSDSDSPLSDLADDQLLASSDDEPLRVKRRTPPPKKKKIIKLKFSKRKDKLAQKFPASSKKEKTAERPEKSSKSLKQQSSKSDKVERPEKAEKTIKKDKPESADKAKKPEAVKAEVIETPKPTRVEQPAVAAPVTPVMPPPAPLPLDVQPTVESDDAAMIAALKAEPGPSETPPAIPAELPPGSVLVGVAPEDIPAKRKGPGRPPKNGVMSKRDEAIIKRLTKDLQKQGKIVPTLNELLLMARAEGTTKKDKDEKFGEDGKPILEGSMTPGPSSIPIDPSIMQSVEGASQGTPQAASQASPDKDTKPKRVVRTPSPQKPESEYTEEELKKPTQTYVVLIHEALSKSNTGIMDLQQIYDAMQKMYPFFKYRAGTSGWQSSVRHNLISSEAFQEAGKIGKGRLWKINPDVSIDKEKKRKAPTPPPQTAPQYPYYPNQQYPYGPPQHGGQGYSPYARPSPYGTPYGPPAGQPGARPPVPAPQQKPGTYYSPYASNPMGGAHASPYGPPSRPPYAAAPYPPQNQGQPNAAGQPGPSPYGPPQQSGQQPPQQQQQQQPVVNGQPSLQAPPQQGQSQPQVNGQSVQQQPYQQQPNGQYPPQQNGGPPQQQQQGQYQQQPSGQYQQPQNGQNQAHPTQYAPSSSQPPQQQQQQQPPPPAQAPQPSPAPASTPTQQPGGIDIAKALAEIMNYQQQYMSGFASGQESDDARAMFTRAMTRAISGANQDEAFSTQAEADLTKRIGEIYAQSRFEAAPAQPQVQAPPPQAAPRPVSQYSSAQPTPSPAPVTSSRPPPPQQAVNTTPAPPQGNIPARYLPPQYNPQANLSATPQPPSHQHPPQQQGQHPRQQPQSSAPPPPSQQQPQQQQHQQQQRQGSTSEAHLAQALSAYNSPQPSAPGTPVQGNAGQSHAPSPSPYVPNGQSSYQSQARPVHPVGQPPGPAHGQVQAQNGNMVQHTQHRPMTPQAQGSAQQPPRPTFTPAPGAPPGSGQQSNKMPPRPTFAPSPVTGPSAMSTTPVPAPPAQSSVPAPTQSSVPTPATGSANASAVASTQSSAQTPVTVGSAAPTQPSSMPRPSSTQVPVPPPTQSQLQDGKTSGSSLKRPIEIDGDDEDGSEAKKTKIATNGNGNGNDTDGGGGPASAASAITTTTTS